MELKVHLWAGWSCEDLVHSSQLPRYGNGDPERPVFLSMLSFVPLFYNRKKVLFYTCARRGLHGLQPPLLSPALPVPSGQCGPHLRAHRTRPPGLNEAWLPDWSIPGLHGKGILEKLMGEFCMRISPQIYLRCLVYVVLPFRAEVASSLLLGR